MNGRLKVISHWFELVGGVYVPYVELDNGVILRQDKKYFSEGVEYFWVEDL